MTHTISALKARQNLGDILNRIALRRDQFIIERDGRPMAAVIPIEQFERIHEAARALLSDAMAKSRARGRAVPAGSEETLADEAKHSSRGKRRPA
ncbi:MAG: type II toxin-antitoxin system Phd/YefM family antitoxin [Elusimicrobia bacterium]|nr:type II toxin-antitoxin system Phd/YefM family antitoxin [Elusimicrobiota bacterium]